MEETEHFSKEELCCPHCGECHMDRHFMERIESIRIAYGKPMQVSSGYRCSTYNIQVSSTGAFGPHTTGMAIDIVIKGADALRVVALAQHRGITGIGVSQKGPHEKRFLHLDRLDTIQPRPWIWSY